MPYRIVGNANQFLSKYLVMTGLGLAFSLGSASVFAQQGQPGDVTGTATVTIDQQDSQAQPPQNQAPPYQEPPYPALQNQGAMPPQTLTVPAGTVIRVRTNEWLSSDRNLPGDKFNAILDQPIVVNGWVVARRGQEETGLVSMAQKAGHGNNNSSQLGVQLSELTLVDGQQVPLQTQLVQSSAGSSNGRNAAIIGTTTGVGAVIGAAAGGGSGAAAGAVVGGAAGIIGAFSTHGRPTVIAPESVLTFRLQDPVTISTEKAQQAFQPVTQQDYDSRGSYGRPQPQRFAGTGASDPPPQGYQQAPPPPPPSYYGYPYAYYGYPYAYGYPYPYYYPYPFGLGFYGGYGFGYGRGFGGFRGGFRR